jgi:flagellar basal-body rod protein FlgG
VAHQERLNVIGNNLANVNTFGFKPMRTAFKDLIYQNINRPDAVSPADVGHGVKINKNDLIMTEGMLNPTQRDLDFALVEENAFFASVTPAGDIRYTRNGAFALSNEDDVYYLVTGNGDRVLDADGEEIEIEFDENGMYNLDPNTLGVFRFPNPYGLWAMSGTTFVETPESGAPTLVDEEGDLLGPIMRRNYLENSAVEIAVEMTGMIEASKAFSFSAKMAMTADEIEQTVNSLR